MPSPKKRCRHSWTAQRAPDGAWIAVCDQPRCPARTKDISDCKHRWVSRPHKTAGLVAFCARCATQFPFTYEVAWGWMVMAAGEEHCEWKVFITFAEANQRFARASNAFSWAKLFRVWPDDTKEPLKSGGPAEQLDVAEATRRHRELEDRLVRQFPEEYHAAAPAPLKKKRKDPVKTPLPRSPRKRQALAARAANQQSLFHPDDPRDEDANPRDAVGRVGDRRRNGRDVVGDLELVLVRDANARLLRRKKS